MNMYNEYFGLNELPFSIAPDPRYLYMSEQHREALAHLLYGFNSSGGFVLLTGEVGTGKTTVCRCLLDQVPENSAIAFIINPRLTVEELLATICDEFGIAYREGTTSNKVFIDLINAFLLDTHAGGRKAVVIIDEAQNLSTDVLEQLRLLTNLETSQCKLLQIILLGQPELREKLSRPELQQLSQRIIARYHLGPLSRNDIGSYITHRLSVAGLRRQLFTDATVKKLFHLTGGVPRLINVLCDRALLGTFAQGKNEVNKPTLLKAAREVLGEEVEPDRYRRTYAWLMSILVIAVFGGVLAASFYNNGPVQTVNSDSVEPEILQEQVIPDPPPRVALQLPDALSFDKSRETAFRELFSRWKISYQEDENVPACSQAQSHGLQCLKGSGSFLHLQGLNRPAVLLMSDDQGKQYHITLNSIKKDTAVITLGSETLEVPLMDITSRWLGDYTLLWRVPPGYQDVLRRGSQNPSVKWLETQLAVIQGREPAAGDNLILDDKLVSHVREFQTAEGLVPDGIAGVLTIIHINTAIDNNVPRLKETQEDI